MKSQDLAKTFSLLCRPNDQEQVDEARKCHICLRTSELTEEHVPPRSAFNDSPRLWYRLALDGTEPRSLRFKNRNGIWVRTLCESCNKERCAPYAAEYVKLVKHLTAYPRLTSPDGISRITTIPASTLFVAKEIATMILAVEPYILARRFAALRDFVMDPRSTITPPFRVLAFEVPDDPDAGTLSTFQARVDTFAPGYRFIGGEISMFPFGFVYAWEIGPAYKPHTMTDITHWFSDASPGSTRGPLIRLWSRLIGIDSVQATLGYPRHGPQIDRVADIG